MASLDIAVGVTDRAKIAEIIVEWKPFAPYLGLTDKEQKAIEEKKFEEQASEALRKWQVKTGDDGTYRALIAAATAARNKQLADFVKNLTTAGAVAEDGGNLLGAPTAKGSSKCAMTCFTDWMKLIEKKDYSRAAALWVEFKEKLWSQGQKLKVEFLDKKVPSTFVNTSGAYITKEEILDIANEWHRCGQDVVPEFVECKFGDVPDIQVEYAKGVSESEIGTDANGKSPSMRLDLSPHFYKRTIRHEFGHALGLMHDHQHPDAPEQYDEEKLRVYLISKGVAESNVDKTIKDQWRAVKSRKVKEGDYDKDSVMHYLIPEEARKPGPTGCYRENLQTELSEGDKKYIVQIYLKAQEEGMVKEDSGTSTNPTSARGTGATAGVGGEAKELTTDDMISVTTYLAPLSKEQVKTLGMLLGLSHATVWNNYEGSSASIYLDSIMTAWFRKQDKVIENGGPRWSVLVKALRHERLRQNGIAENIRTKELS